MLVASQICKSLLIVRSSKVVEIIYKSLRIQLSLNIRLNYNYLHKVTYICIKIKNNNNNKKKNGVSAKTAIIQVVKKWKVLEGSWQYRELGSAHGMFFGSLRGKVKVTACVGTVWIKVVF